MRRSANGSRSSIPPRDDLRAFGVVLAGIVGLVSGVLLYSGSALSLDDPVHASQRGDPAVVAIEAALSTPVGSFVPFAWTGPAALFHPWIERSHRAESAFSAPDQPSLRLRYPTPLSDRPLRL